MDEVGMAVQKSIQTWTVGNLIIPTTLVCILFVLPSPLHPSILPGLLGRKSAKHYIYIATLNILKL